MKAADNVKCAACGYPVAKPCPECKRPTCGRSVGMCGHAQGICADCVAKRLAALWTK